jgi:hypothetical protein
MPTIGGNWAPREDVSAAGLRCCRRSFDVSRLLGIWEFAPKRYPKISSLILRYPKISLDSKKSKDMF